MNFYGERGATLTVSLQKTGGQYTEFAEIQFAVKGKIRRDVVLNPGELNFDEASIVSKGQRTARVLYAGNVDWKILEVKSTSPNFTAEAKEIERNPSTGRVTYDVIVTSNGEQTAGKLNEYLTIVTNDAKTNGMPVSIKINPSIKVSPIQLGVVTKDQNVKKKLIVRSATAFSIKQIITNDSRIQFAPVDGEKSLHILEYTLDTSVPGKINQQIEIVTSGSSQAKTKVPFEAQIIPATVVLENAK